MTNYTIIGDIHIAEKHFSELTLIFEEIFNLSSSSQIIFLGDIFHKNKPTPNEVIFALKWFFKFKSKCKTITVILGNHDLYGGIQTTKMLTYLGITIISNNTWKEYTPFGCLTCGHYFVKESMDNYNDTQKSIKEYAKSDYTFLGHQHRFQQLDVNAYHLGSVRYIGFGEYDKFLIPKKIAHIDNKGNLKFIDLKKPYPLVQFNSVDELLTHYKQTNNLITDKIRIVYDTFNAYKNDINKLNNLPYIFTEDIKLKLDFKNQHIIKHFNTNIHSNQLSTNEIFKKWIETISDKDVKSILEQEWKISCN